MTVLDSLFLINALLVVQSRLEVSFNESPTLSSPSAGYTRGKTTWILSFLNRVVFVSCFWLLAVQCSSPYILLVFFCLMKDESTFSRMTMMKGMFAECTQNGTDVAGWGD